MRRALLLSTMIMIGIVAGFFGVAHAQTFRSGNSATVGANEVVDGTLWTTGKTVDIVGQVNGDLFCAGQTVTVSGTVHGDVICAAQTITISGTVDGNVRSAAQTFNVSGNVMHNLTAAAQSFNQAAKASVAGDASVAGSDVTFNGTIGRDAALAGQNVTINGQIARNVTASVEQLSLGSGAKIGGDLSYTSKNEVLSANDAVVAGTTTKYLPKEQPQRRIGSVVGFGVGAVIFAALAGLVFVLTLVLLIPQTIHNVTNQAIKSPWKTLLVGFLASLIVPILFIIILLTVIGIPLALLLIGVWILISSLSGVMSAYYTGRLIWKDQHNAILIMLVGSLLLFVLYFIPIIGVFVALGAYFMGTGMLLLEAKRFVGSPNYRVK